MYLPEKQRNRRAAIVAGTVFVLFIAIAIYAFLQMPNTKGTRLLLAFAATAAFTFPAAAYFFTAKALPAQSFKDAASWPRVKGKMLRQEVKSVDTGDGYQDEADFAYRFTLNGVTHVADAIRPGPRVALYLPPEVHLEQYNPGREVTVYVNLAEPSESVLDPNLEQRGTVEVLSIFVAMPVLVVLLVWMFV